MILCDTNILIEVYRGNQTVIDKLKVIGQENLAISDVTAAELLFGARNKNELKIIKADINKLIEISINEEISRMAVLLVEKYSLSHNLSLPSNPTSLDSRVCFQSRVTYCLSHYQ